jgi:tetratricopeptide (TPR) repeat protein
VRAGDGELLQRLNGKLRDDPLAAETQLAVVLSVATRVEVELLRAVRLAVLPRLDVGAESDFWFSEWIGWRRPRAVALRPYLLDPLRDRLRHWLATADEKHPIHALRGVVDRMHAGLSPALRLEEQINWMVLTEGEQGVREAAELLYRPLRAMHEDNPRREPLADWALAASLRLPEAVRASTALLHLLLGAKAFRPYDVDVALPDTGREKVMSLLAPVAKLYRERPVAIRWDGDDLLIGGHHHPGALTIDIHDVTPLYIRVAPKPTHDWQLIEVDDREAYRYQSQGRDLWLRTTEGDYFEVPSPVGDSVVASPVLVKVSLAGTKPAAYWLQPVSYRRPKSAQVEQPLAILDVIRMSMPADDAALHVLGKWRDTGNPVDTMALSGGPESHRVLVADQFAAASEAQGWQVYRARQDPDASTWLVDGPPRAGARGTLVVVDRADSWHVRHLIALISLLDSKARVLLLATSTDRWWTECSRGLAAQRLLYHAYSLRAKVLFTSSPQELFDECLDKVAEALGLASSAQLQHTLRTADVRRLEVADIPVVAVATGVSSLARRTASAAVSPQAQLLDLEHLYRITGTALTDENVAKLSFIAALMRPLTHQIGQAVSEKLGLIPQASDWTSLLSAYESLYQAAPGFVAYPGPPELADALVTNVLLTTNVGGVDRRWAADAVQLDKLAEHGDDASLAGVGNAIAMLARLSASSPELAVRYLLPFLRKDPGLPARAGAVALSAVAALDMIDIGLLARIVDSLPAEEDRRVDLDVAAWRMEETLFQAASPTAARLLRLAGAQHRAGQLRAAQASAKAAVDKYHALVSMNVQAHTAGLCAALIRSSRICGELGEAGAALEFAMEAERQAKMLGDQYSVGVNHGVALANLARQKAGRAEGALDDATRAVSLLEGLTSTAREYRSDLVDARIVLSNRLADVAPDAAFEQAEFAVDLAEELTAGNEWAHGHRLAAAYECLAARLHTMGHLAEALVERGKAIELLERAAQASPDKFRFQFAQALASQAHLLRRAGRDDQARVAAESAASIARQLPTDTSPAAGKLLAEVAHILSELR